MFPCAYRYVASIVDLLLSAVLSVNLAKLSRICHCLLICISFLTFHLYLRTRYHTPQVTNADL